MCTSIVVKTLLRHQQYTSWIQSSSIQSAVLLPTFNRRRHHRSRWFSNSSRILPAGPEAAETISDEHDSYERAQDVIHLENENAFMYSKFKLWPEYKSSIVDTSAMESSSTKWNSYRPIVQQIKELSVHNPPPIMDPSLEQLRKSISSELSQLNDDELFGLLYSLSLLPKTRRLGDPEYKEFWQTLDTECLNRFKGWDYDTLFVVDDLLTHLRIARAANFHYQLVRKLFRKIEKLNKFQYVRFMFSLNLSRRTPTFMSAFELQCGLQKFIQNLTPEETAIVVLALFKTETKLRDSTLIETIADRAMSASKTLDSVFVGAFAKFLRFTSRSEVVTSIYKFQDVFLPEVDRLDPPACIQLALTGTTTLSYHSKLVNAVRDKIDGHLHVTRLKEIERLLLVLTMFNHECEAFCKKVVIELGKETRAREMEAYGRSVPAVVYYLSMNGVFIEKLISQVLETKFLLEYYGKNMAKYQRELLCLDFAVGMDCPGYQGSRLDTKLKGKIARFYLFHTSTIEEKRVGHKANLREVVQVATGILGGEQFTYLCNILPQYYTADLVFCLDEKNNAVSTPKKFREIPSFEVKWIPTKEETEDQNLSFHAILMCNRNACFFNSDTLLGQGVAQHRLLRKMGFSVHPVFPLEWDECQKNPEKQKSLLMKKIFNSILNSKKPARDLASVN